MEHVSFLTWLMSKHAWQKSGENPVLALPHWSQRGSTRMDVKWTCAELLPDEIDPPERVSRDSTASGMPQNQGCLSKETIKEIKCYSRFCTPCTVVAFCETLNGALISCLVLRIVFKTKCSVSLYSACCLCLLSSLSAPSSDVSGPLA